MSVLFDVTFLVLLLDPKFKEAAQSDARFEYLLDRLAKAKTKIIVPTPALSEVLIGAGDAAPHYLDIINNSSRFKILPFGERAAVEAAARHREAIDEGDKKEGLRNWPKVKYDRQIFAIAKVEAVECIYSNDSDIVKLGKKDGVEVCGLEELPFPPEDPQTKLDV
jgi:predicted nucleic acid-binding protein